jgi:hypothetical protein
MSWQRRVQGGLLAFIGFMLSPLSWWNDLFVNVPLAIGFGWLVALAHPPAFEPAVIVGYWLTNVLGFVLLHYGTRNMLKDAEPKPYSRRDLLRALLISLAYTLLLFVLVKLKVIQQITAWFAKGGGSG